jgi:cytochrome c oxidase cbb3-type subunit 3
MADLGRSGGASHDGGNAVEIDQPTGQATTGHEWDGIKELNTPLPRWWLWTFYATIAFSLVYVVLYPAVPLLDSATRGVLGYSTRGEVEKTLQAAQEAQAGNLERVASLPLDEIAADDDLLRFAVAGGRSAFLVNCVQCHGSGAAGSPGYPNLNDDDWLWGGTLEDIHTTISNGIRFDQDAETRVSEMPAFSAGILDKRQINSVANHVLSLSGADHDAALAQEGAEIFAANCAACHGEGGEGNRELGAPALDDAIWLYRSSLPDIAAQVARPRHGVMPAWSHRLDETTIKELTLFVHSLGGGEATIAGTKGRDTFARR